MRSAVLVLLPLLFGCGYRMAGSIEQAPGGIESVSVGRIENRSREEGLDKTLAFAFEREFYERGALRLRESPDEGDGIISGTIRDFRIRPVSFDADDDALQYEAQMTLDVTVRRADGSLLWKGANMKAYQEYSVNRQTVVPSSSQFQQGTLDFNDLSDLTDIQLAETEKRLAIERMLRAIVRDVHDRLLDDF